MINPKLAAVATLVSTLMGADTANVEAHTHPLTDRPAVVFFLSVINPDEPEAYERYSAGSAQLLHQAGVLTLGQFGVAQALLGDCKGNFFGYAEVANAESLEAVFQSDAYKALLPERAKAFSTLELYFGTSNVVGPNSVAPKKGSAVLLTLGGRAIPGGETSSIAFPTAKILASFNITKHVAGDCAVDRIQLLEQDTGASQTVQSTEGIDGVFLLNN